MNRRGGISLGFLPLPIMSHKQHVPWRRGFTAFRYDPCSCIDVQSSQYLSTPWLADLAQLSLAQNMGLSILNTNEPLRAMAEVIHEPSNKGPFRCLGGGKEGPLLQQEASSLSLRIESPCSVALQS